MLAISFKSGEIFVYCYYPAFVVIKIFSFYLHSFSARDSADVAKGRMANWRQCAPNIIFCAGCALCNEQWLWATSGPLTGS